MNLNNFDMEDSVKERLIYFLKYLNLGQTAFENKVGWSRGHISKIKGAIGSDMLAKLVEKYPELNVDWLLTGKGDMFKSSVNDSKIRNVKGNVTANTAGHVGGNVDMHTYNAEKIIKENGDVELYGDAQSIVEKLEIENKYLNQRIADLDNIINMKDKLILMLEEKLKFTAESKE